MSDSKKIWIEMGYKCFAWHGPEGVKVDAIANHIGISRSSFYHNFCDFEHFEEELFNYHWQQSKLMAQEGKSIHDFYPAYAKHLEKYKDWLFFHKHMFLLRKTEEKYNAQFKKVRAITEDKLREIWLKTAGLSHLPIQHIEHFSYLMRESLFGRIHYESFNAELLKEKLEALNLSFRILLSDETQSKSA